jgi:hypothetical protein
MMLRNAAAVPTLLSVLFATTVFVAVDLLGAGSARALDGIDLRDAATAPAEGECPALVKIRYPFLKCAGTSASAELLQVKPTKLAPSWASARQSPRMSDWTESDGYWGPDLNQD